MNWEVIIAVAAVVLLAVAGVVTVGVWPAIRDVTGDPGEKLGVDMALAAHEAELRAVRCHDAGPPDEPPHIVVKVKEITPEVRRRAGDAVRLPSRPRVGRAADLPAAALRRASVITFSDGRAGIITRKGDAGIRVDWDPQVYPGDPADFGGRLAHALLAGMYQ